MADLGQVFVPGGQPNITYVPRNDLQLEEKLQDYLGERHRILSLAGPTKSGKTVLIRKVVPNAIWLFGGNIRSIDRFWGTLVDKLGAYTTETRERTGSETTTDELSGGAGLNTVVRAGIDKTHGQQRTEGKRQSFSRTRSDEDAALDLLAEQQPVVVIDDFHYLDPTLQQSIVRGLKAAVFEGLPVILASVPHRAFDAVRVEKEMTGRVEHVTIPFWSPDDLEGIAHRGFDALNVTSEPTDVSMLAEQSFGSPHLMQDFCLQFCKSNGVRETLHERRSLRGSQWKIFFRDRASNASKTAFDLLAQGPRQRTDRKVRKLKGGHETDIYGAVLRAIAATGPATALPMDQLRTSLRVVLDEEPPSFQEVARVLEKMNEIARDKIEGEPVLDYDVQYETLYISDPYFAYFLRWGTYVGFEVLQPALTKGV
jgi:hypothetical protein